MATAVLRPSAAYLTPIVLIFCWLPAAVSFVQPPLIRRKRNCCNRLWLHGLQAETGVQVAEIKRVYNNEQLDPYANSDDNGITIRVTGHISKRRVISKKSLIFLDLICSSDQIGEKGDLSDATLVDDNKNDPIQILLRRDLFGDNSSSSFDTYASLLQPGCLVEVSGFAGKSRRSGENLLMANSAQYLKPNSNPQHLRLALALVVAEEKSSLPSLRRKEIGNSVGMEIATALDMTYEELQERLVNFSAVNQSSDVVLLNNHNEALYQLAKDLIASMIFQKKKLLDPSKMSGSSPRAKVQLLPSPPRQLAQPPSHLSSLLKEGRYQEETANITSFQSVRELLKNVTAIASATTLLEESTLDPQLVTVTGWVQNRRRFQQNISMFYLADDSYVIDSESKVESVSIINTKDDFVLVNENETNCTSNGKTTRDKTQVSLLRCILHPQLLTSNLVAIYGNLLCQGAKVVLQGRVTSSSEKDTTVTCLWITSQPKLIKCSPRPGVVRLLLDLLAERCGRDSDEPSLNEIAKDAVRALRMTTHEVQKIASTDDATQRQWMVANLVQRLQDESNSNKHRNDAAFQEQHRILQKFQMYRDQFPLIETELDEFLQEQRTDGLHDDLMDSENIDNKHMTTRFFKSSIAGSWYESAKKPQLKWMMMQIRDVLEKHPEYNKRRLQIVDVGGGRGHLAKLVAHEFKEIADVRVVDISARSINNGMRSAKQLKLDNLSFDWNDATAIDLKENMNTDVVIALHACGALSDVAIGHAIVARASFCVCPCCFRSNPYLQVPALSLLQQQHTMSRLPPFEWLQITPEELNALQYLAEMQNDRTLSAKAIHTLSAVRATAALHHYSSNTSNGSTAVPALGVSIKTFPLSFSTRNFCIIGKLQ